MPSLPGSLACATAAVVALSTTPARAQAPPAAREPGAYTLGPDSLPQPGVPKGRLEGPLAFKSQIIAGTVRRYWIYVPAQYKRGASRPTCSCSRTASARPIRKASLRVPQVLENLIHKSEIPVTIGIFITPGPPRRDLSRRPRHAATPNNRAAEYDALSDAYARFLIEEMLPEVGKSYNLTTDPERRAIGGTSSGAICAFTVAWHRPDQFRNVISMIGSYTSIGYRPAQGRPADAAGRRPLSRRSSARTPSSPCAIFLQDGSQRPRQRARQLVPGQPADAGGAALRQRAADTAKTPGPRYDVKHEWGDGAHSDAARRRAPAGHPALALGREVAPAASSTGDRLG